MDGGHDGRPVLSVSWDSDGAFLASGGEDNRVRVWQVPGGEQLRELRLPSGGSVLSVDWGRDFLAAGGGPYDLVVWTPDAWQAQRQYELKPDARTVVQWSPDGSRLYSAGYGLVALDTRAWEPVRVSETRWIEAMALSPAGDLLCVEEENHVWMFDVRDLLDIERLRELTPIHGDVISVAWAPDGRMLALGSDDGSVEIWGVATDDIAPNDVGIDEVSRTLKDVSIWLAALEDRINSPQANSLGLEEAAELHELYLGWLASAENAVQEGEIDLAKSLADRLVEALAPAPISLNSETLAQFECEACEITLDEESGGFRVIPQDSWRLGLKDQHMALGDYEIDLRFKLLGTDMIVWWRDSYNPTGYVPSDRHHAYAIRLDLRTYGFGPDGARGFQKWVDQIWSSNPVGGLSPIVIGDFPFVDSDTWYSLGISAMDNRITITLDGKTVYDFRESTSPILFGGFNIGSNSDEVLIDSLKIEWIPYGE